MCEGKDEEVIDKGRKIPPLEEGELRFCSLLSSKHEQNFTKPPARYTDDTLIKAMEDKGIGRPSTYAANDHAPSSTANTRCGRRNCVPDAAGQDRQPS